MWNPFKSPPVAIPVQPEARRGVAVTPPRARRVNMGGNTRNFADATDTGRLNASWTTQPATVDSYIYQFWSMITARARDQAEKSDHARKFLQLCRDNIAGPDGFKLQSQVKDPSGDADIAASRAIESAWLDFSRKGRYEITKGMSRAALERLLVTTVAMDGEAFLIKRYRPDFEHTLTLQLVDPVSLDPQYFEKLSNGNSIKHGIEFNEFDQPVAYYFRNHEERQHGYSIGTGSKYQRIDAENVIHIFIVERAGQKRGLSWMRTALFRLKTLAAFEDAALINARVGASKMGFFYDENGDPGGDGEDITMDAEPGTFENIGTRKFVEWNPQFPDASVEQFCKTALRSISSGLFVSYNNLASDLTSVNFSSLRQGSLDERESWKGLQSFMIDSYCDPVFETWLPLALLAEKVKVQRKGGGLAPLSLLKLDKFSPHLFRGRRWSWISPREEVQANADAVAQGFKSRTEVIEDMGRDAEDVWDEIARENEQMKKLKIEVAPFDGVKIEQPTSQEE